YDAGGMPLFGSHFVAMLYGGGNPDSLNPALVGFAGPPLGPVPVGLLRVRFSGSAAYVDTVGGACGAQSYLQVRAWDTAVAPTYEAAVALNIGGYGESEVFLASGGNACPPAF